LPCKVGVGFGALLKDKLDFELGKMSLHGKGRYSVGAPDFRKKE